MTHLVWITGRAATGKSTLIRELGDHLRQHRLTSRVLSDEDHLFTLKAADLNHEHHYHPHGGTDFLPRNGHLFDEGIRRISAELTSMLDNPQELDVALIELARGGRTEVVDVSYGRALELVNPALWPHSTVIRLNVPFHVQLSRNTDRRRAVGHSTPGRVMAELYAHDSPDALRQAGITVTEIPSTATPSRAAAQVLALLPLRAGVR